MTDQGLVGFASLVILYECTCGDHQESVCLSGPKSFSHQLMREQREALEKRKENPSFWPSCPFRGRENLTWLTWTHLASLANRKCAPQLFFVGGGSVPAQTVMDKCYRPCLPLIFDLKTKNWHYKCPVISSKLAWHSIAGPKGFLFVLCKWFCSCCCVPRLAIRTYWPFSQECGILKRHRERLERKRERAKRGPGCVFEYLCSLS